MKLPRASAVVSTVFGIGYFPQAQGTIMSAIAVPLAILLAIVGHGGMVVAGAAIIVLVVGILSCSDYVRETGNPDPSECVIDELAGQWLACSFVAFSPFQLAPFFLVFALFRLFDIWKPWPIRRLEALPTGTGIMLDDVAAGLLALLTGLLLSYLHHQL